MEKRLWLAMVISFLLLFLYQAWIVKKRGLREAPGESPPAEVATQETLPEKSVVKEERPQTIKIAPASGKIKDVIVEHELYTAVFSTEDAALKSFRLKGFRTEVEPDSPLVELVSQDIELKPLRINLLSNYELPEHLVFNTDKDSVLVSDEESLTFVWEVKGGMRIEKEFRFFKDSYKMELSVRIINLQSTPLKNKLSLGWHNGHGMNKARRAYHEGAVVYIDNKLKRETLKEGEKKELRGRIEWLAMEKHYFLSAILPETREGLSVTVDSDKGLSLLCEYEPVIIPAGDRTEYRFVLFLGPKDISALRPLGRRLEMAVDLGWFKSIAGPLLNILKWLYGVFKNYGTAIIILTILVRIVFFPLSIMSYRSMKKMQVIQPMIKELQKKFADNRERLNREMMDLYRRHKVNPFGGCLPLIVQIPVFIALYQTLMNAIELRHAGFIFWINDLSSPEALFYVPFMGYNLPFRVLPILMGLTMYIQQKLTPQVGDPQQLKILMWMPLILMVMLYNLPSGLNLYWSVSNLLSILQQIYINRKVKV